MGVAMRGFHEKRELMVACMVFVCLLGSSKANILGGLRFGGFW